MYEKPTRFKESCIRKSSTYYVIECILLIVVFGFRNYVGGDTISYIAMWDLVPDLSEVNLLNFVASRFMPFWYFLCASCKTISDEFWILSLTQAAIVNIVTFIAISKLTKYRFTASLIYLLYLSLYFNCEIMRESIAVSFFMLAFPYFIEKKWFQYYFLCFVGYMFHSSAFLCFLYPFLYRYATRKLNVRSLFVVLLFASVLFVEPLFMYISNQLPDALNIFKSDRYGELSNATWFGTVREILTSLLLFVLIRRRDRHEDVNNVVDAGLKMYWLLITLGIGLHILTNRFANYFKLYEIVLIVQIIWVYKKKDLIPILFIINIMFGQYRLYTRESSKLALKHYMFYEQFYPYYSIFENVPQDVIDNRIQYMTSENE